MNSSCSRLSRRNSKYRVTPSTAKTPAPTAGQVGLSLDSQTTPANASTLRTSSKMLAVMRSVIVDHTLFTAEPVF